MNFLISRRFLPLFLTQFLGASNDNLLKTALAVLVGFGHFTTGNMAPGVAINLSAGVFILPFLLFSSLAGSLADRYDKARLAQLVKQVECVIVLLVGVGLWLKSFPLLLGALFLLGTHSAFFGPIKYGVLPQYLKREELVTGNAWIEMGTFLAILCGQMGGALLAGQHPQAVVVVGLIIALLGVAMAFQMPTALGNDHVQIDPNLFKATFSMLKEAHSYRSVWTALLGISWFWLAGAVCLTQLPSLCKIHLHGDEQLYTLLLMTYSIGIGLGSFLCERLSHQRIRPLLVTIGAFGLVIFGVDVFLAIQWGGRSPQVFRVGVDFLLLGLSGGLFTVPLYAWMQLASPISFRGRAVAANNILNALFMVTAAGISAGLLAQGITPAGLFLVVSLGTGGFMLLLIQREPLFLSTQPLSIDETI